jgi:uncharacterized Zn-finger protein
MALSGPAARAVQCPLCGDMFFPASMKFHLKACEKKQAATLVQCPYCSREYPRLELAKHTLRCKDRPKDVAAPRGKGDARSAAQKAARASHAASRSVYSAYASGEGAELDESAPTSVDARVPCSVCGRKFAPERIAVHEKACGRLADGASRRGLWKGSRPGAPGAAGRPTTAPTLRMASQRAVESVTAGDAKDSKTSWRQQHQQLQRAMKAVRQSPGDHPSVSLRTEPEGDDGLVPCPHCGRTFSAHAAQRHVVICANVVNRPRPPPTASNRPHTAATGSPHRRVVGPREEFSPITHPGPVSPPHRRAKPPPAPTEGETLHRALIAADVALARAAREVGDRAHSLDPARALLREAALAAGVPEASLTRSLRVPEPLDSLPSLGVRPRTSGGGRPVARGGLSFGSNSRRFQGRTMDVGGLDSNETSPMSPLATPAQRVHSLGWGR